MSALFNTVGERLERATGIVAANVDYTCLFWVRKNSALPPSYCTAFEFFGAGSIYLGIFIYPSGNLSIDADNGGGGANLATQTGIVADTWYPVAYVRTGSTHALYINGVAASTPSGVLAFGAGDFTDLVIGDDGFGDSDLEVQYFREYDRALTLAEVNTELGSTAPVDTTDLWSDLPLVTDANDDGPNGYNLSAVGAVSYIAGPPINTSRTFAQDITNLLPFAAAVDAHYNGITYNLWYKYTSQSGDKVLGAWGFGDLVTYKPTQFAYTGASGSADFSAQNKRTQHGLIPPTEYFYEFRSNAGNPTPAVLNLDFLLGPNDAVPVGSIAVNDDTVGYPLVLIDKNTGDVLNFVHPFPAGELADILTDGTLLVFDSDTNEFVLFDDQYNELARVSTSFETRSLLRACLTGNKFYVSNSATGVVRTIDSAGNVGGTTWTLTVTQLYAIAPSTDELILYYADGADKKIKRWNLSSDSALSDLASYATPSVGSFVVTDIIVLEDDTILVCYAKAGETRVIRYNTAGTILNTYQYSSVGNPAGTLSRIATALDNPTSFWLWNHSLSPSGFSNFINIRVSDGVELTTVVTAEYETGVYQPAVTATPYAKFGNSFSCPFWITRATFPEVSNTGTIIVQKIVLPTDATSFDFTAGGGLSPSSFSLLDGETEQYNDVPVGSGYSIVETPNAGYVTTYEVSNGSPNTNISVADGETVIVTVTNKKRGGLVVGKVSDPFSYSHEFNFVAGGGLSPTTFTLESEEEQEFIDLDPNQPYSIVEVLDPEYFPIYLISNDSPNNAIVIDPGETIVVMILNQLSSDGSGIYELIPDVGPNGTPKTDDTIVNQEGELVRVKIPNPFAIVGPMRDL